MSDAQNTTPTFAEVNTLCGRLATTGRIPEATVVGNLWQEKERLREALTKIRDSDYQEGEWPIKVAREALGE